MPIELDWAMRGRLSQSSRSGITVRHFASRGSVAFGMTALAATILVASCASLAPASPFRIVHRDESGSGWTLRLDYPRLPSAPAADAKIEAWIGAAVADFHSQSETNREAWAALASPEEKARPRPPHELLVDWRADSSGPRFISLVLHRYWWVGGAHGDDALLSINYDLGQERFLAIGDIVTGGGADPLARISALSRQALRQRFAGDPKLDLWIAEGTAPTRENFADFSFDEDRLFIHFAKYQIGPGSLGLVELSLPRDLDKGGARVEP